MTDEFSEEFDLVFPLLASVENGIGYNDNSGLLVGELNYTKEFKIADVDGGLIDPYTAMRKEFEDQIRSDYEALMASGPKQAVFTDNGVEYQTPDTEFKIRSAIIRHRELFENDTYEFWLNLTV